MDSAGTFGSSIEVHTISRKSSVDARFKRFRIGKWSINDFRNLDWKESTANIKSWIRVAHTCYCSIFPWEKQYFEQIFGWFRAATFDNRLKDVVIDVAVELNNFAEAVTTTTASFQKLFDTLVLFLILPEIKTTLHYKSSTAYIYLGAVRNVDGLGNLARQMLSNFAHTALNEQLNTPGIIHSLTRYAMDHITRVLTCKDLLLAKIIISEPIKIRGISEDEQFLEVGWQNQLGLHLTRITISLKYNLEVKSRHYEDSLLGILFLMNNVHYIVEKIKGSSELVDMIEEDYYSTRLSEYVLQAAKTYVGFTWNRVLICLREETRD